MSLTAWGAVQPVQELADSVGLPGRELTAFEILENEQIAQALRDAEQRRQQSEILMLA